MGNSVINPPSTATTDAKGNTLVGFGDSPSLDAFSRLRVSNPVALFDSKSIRGFKETLAWTEKLTGGGTSTLDANRSSTLLTVTNIGDQVIRQSRRRIIYQPGKSHLIFVTCQPPVADANVRTRMGYFDANDGIFLEQTGSTLTFVVRSSVTGSPVDANRASAATWNLDGLGLDGLGLDGNPLNPSGWSFDITKNYLVVIDFQWLSLGRVRVGFDLDGHIVYVHEFLHSNVLSSAYMRNPNLVIRYEITAVGAPGAARTLEMICSSVISEGGHTPEGMPTSFSNGRTPVVANNNYVEIMAFRVKVVDADKVRMDLIDLSLMCSTNGNIHWALVLNPVGVTGAGTWISAGLNSSVEYNVTRGGGWVSTPGTPQELHKIKVGYFAATTNQAYLDVTSTLAAGTDVDGIADIWSVQVCNAKDTANENIFSAVTVQEAF